MYLAGFTISLRLETISTRRILEVKYYESQESHRVEILVSLRIDAMVTVTRGCNCASVDSPRFICEHPRSVSR